MPRRTPVTLHIVEQGAGTPVLALHGWTPDHRLMLGCLEPVFAHRHGYRRLYPDLPGMGASLAPLSIASSDDLLDAIEDLVDDLIGTAPFLLVGESYGGYLARGLAHARPEQVLGLALICPTGAALEPSERTVPDRLVLRGDPDLLDSLDDRRLAEEFASMAVVQTPGTLRRFRDEILAGLDLADPEAMARIRHRWQLTEDPEGGPRFERPTLILTGRQDHCVGYADQYALLPHYPRASFAILDTAGHNLQIEQPTLFDALILEWLDRVAAEYRTDVKRGEVAHMSDVLYYQVSTTTDTREAASALGESAVRARLAACAQVLGPITSTYWWEGKVEQAEEYLVLLKTTSERAGALQAHLIAQHSYDVPEVIHTPITAGNPAYLSWVGEETRAKG